eukprot:scaffold4690_cov116-Cylindrotheca_fusiformis.AAC.7
MADRLLLTRKIEKVEGILDDIEEEKGTDNKLFRAYKRKLEKYHDQLDEIVGDDDMAEEEEAMASAISLDAGGTNEDDGPVDRDKIKKKYKKVRQIIEDLEREHGPDVKNRKDYNKYVDKKMEYAEMLGIGENGNDDSSTDSSAASNQEKKKKKKKKSKDGDLKKKKKKKSKDADGKDKKKKSKKK